jgi:NAD(P)-dependent dehydrogenase (short-subunit alcohol dehydrogenase family)
LFAQRGNVVAVLARGEDGLEATREELAHHGLRGLALAADVAVADEVEAAAARIEDELGPIDVWVNNAMTTVFGDFLDIEPNEFRRATEVTYLGCVWGTRAALKRIMPRGVGTIVQVGSALAYRGIPLQSAYCGAKHATKGFLDSVRSELRRSAPGVHLTSVELPGLNTPQFDRSRSKLSGRPRPVPPVYQPEVAARAVVWAADHPRRQYQVGYATVATILGSRIASGLVDRYLSRSALAAQEEEDVPARATDNLFAPVAGDPGAHGRFDDEAHRTSPQAFFSRHRLLVGCGVALAAGTLATRR